MTQLSRNCLTEPHERRIGTYSGYYDRLNLKGYAKLPLRRCRTRSTVAPRARRIGSCARLLRNLKLETAAPKLTRSGKPRDSGNRVELQDGEALHPSRPPISLSLSGLRALLSTRSVTRYYGTTAVVRYFGRRSDVTVKAAGWTVPGCQIPSAVLVTVGKAIK
eukprot:762885-Hanusia_phi.AAC.1